MRLKRFLKELWNEYSPLVVLSGIFAFYCGGGWCVGQLTNESTPFGRFAAGMGMFSVALLAGLILWLMLVLPIVRAWRKSK